MKPEQQRIAIAEACGLLIECQRIGGCLHPLNCCCNDHSCDGQEPLPDYLNDLNAMHEAEKMLQHNEKCLYHTALHIITKLNKTWIWLATAAQRAEAFLRTIGKWEE